MANYDPSVRPAENSSEPLKVVFGISLHHIIDVVSACNDVTPCKFLRVTQKNIHIVIALSLLCVAAVLDFD